MPTLQITYRDDKERLLLEQAIAYVRQLHQLALDAPDGTVLATCEKLALSNGRALMRSTLADALQSRVAAAELKGGSHACARRRTPDAPRAAADARS